MVVKFRRRMTHSIKQVTIAGNMNKTVKTNVTENFGKKAILVEQI